MGVYIPGMEMPTNCAFCRFCEGLADTLKGTCAFCMVMKNIPYHTPEVCDGHYCPMDCEAHCPWADEAMEYVNEKEDNEDD